MTSPLTVPAGRVAVRSSAVTGIARKGRRTKDLVKRLKRGDIAVIDHKDLDGLAAQGLADRRVAAVIDAAPPITGRYPNRGPQILAAAGIPLYQMSDADMFDSIPDGKSLTITAQLDLMTGTGPINRLAHAVDTRRHPSRDGRSAGEPGARTGAVRIEHSDVCSPGKSAPDRADRNPAPGGCSVAADRQAVVVVRGEGYREDLLSIRSYIRDLSLC